MHKTLARLGLTLKRSRGGRRPRTGPNCRQRADWRAKQSGMSPARLVFVDEAGAATNMARRYGHSPRGRRLDGPIPHGHWKSTTFVGGLTTRGFVAPYVLDGPMNGTFSSLGSSRCWPRSCGRATSSSWTISVPTRSLGSQGDRGSGRRVALPARHYGANSPSRRWALTPGYATKEKPPGPVTRRRSKVAEGCTTSPPSLHTPTNLCAHRNRY